MTHQRLKILSIFGTRPEAIKMAPVIRELRRYDQVESLVCVTAQHREMLDQALRPFEIVPNYDLDIMQPSQTPNQVLSRILSALEPVLEGLQPDWVLIQGDTTTAMAAAITARHLKIKIGHVEAGLRTWDMDNPFPEEMNRVIADAISDLCFAPTARARNNLLREGISDQKIVITGNTVIDALLEVASRPWKPAVDHPLANVLPCEKGNGHSPKLILVTVHRRENFGDPLRNICMALKDISRKSQTPLRFVIPVHLNPNVLKPVHEILGDDPHFRLVPPLDYLALVNLMKQSVLVLTDSGGIQEEAPSLGVPVLVWRKITERPEGVEAGTVRVVGTDRNAIVEQTLCLLNQPDEYRAMAHAVNPYGDGHAAERIVARLIKEGAYA
jgi:UDP-N-acetylglucosamine 2-epimerase (non-hydrolysing)